MVRQTADQFTRATIERFKIFAHNEAAAANDAERVRLFAEFIVAESRVRRERYSSAIGAMGSEIFDLTRDLFRPMVSRRDSGSSAVEFTPQSSEPSRSHRGSMNSIYREPTPAQTPGSSSSAPPSAGFPISPIVPPVNHGGGERNYMPSLSPILSMSVSDAYEDGSSRGRPASRWWEADSVGEASARLERSKRESKYMGVPKEAREALQWIDTPAGPSRDSNEYPPEKVGWHDQHQEALNTPQPLRLSLPNSPNPAHLDVSRLVTLPPPYPRHHPAVNNNHPELASIRSSVRAISDFSDVEAAKSHFANESKSLRADSLAQSKARRASLRANLQAEINNGNMSYAEAAAIEADSSASDLTSQKDLEKADFDKFQTLVVGPVNDLLTKRIETATQLFDQLRTNLWIDNPQEEGDETPELLEKLTLLKWIFEAREALHKGIYDLLSERNDRYREMVLLPYRAVGNEEKLANAKAFFAEDASKRAVAFANEVLQRTGEFKDVVEENVSRGVEVQLSAFWDIAPPLRRVLDKIPLDVSHFHIQIPSAELVENPVYHDHPLQYLFSLLLHAEKSTYQFIESQTNLLCLLHEVKEAVVVAKVRVLESEGREAEGMRRDSGHRLTEDLQGKVRVVQGQWHEALGEAVGGVKERVGEWLLSTGGWDESLEDGGVGGV